MILFCKFYVFLFPMCFDLLPAIFFFWNMQWSPQVLDGGRAMVYFRPLKVFALIVVRPKTLVWAMERRRESREPFYRAPSSGPLKTSAEIVQEARQSLRTLRTQRPFTPLNDHRQLFGEGSSRPQDGRPPSAFRYLYICPFCVLNWIIWKK